MDLYSIQSENSLVPPQLTPLGTKMLHCLPLLQQRHVIRESGPRTEAGAQEACPMNVGLGKE